MNTQFGYNGDGVRLRRVEAGTSTTYTQDYAAPLPVVLQAKTGTTTTQYVYSLGTRPVAEYEAAAWEYLIPDPLGSVRQIANASGNVTLLKSYEPYGSVLNSQGSAASSFGYAGEQVDAYTKLVFLRARYMQPGLGIFLSRDMWEGDVLRPGSMSGWNYAEGNPINRVDPSGLFSAATLARSRGFSTDPAGVLQWFESNRDYWGWTLLLLDAERGDNIFDWYISSGGHWGRFECQGETAYIQLNPERFNPRSVRVPPNYTLDRPTPWAWTWWRGWGVYDLLKTRSGMTTYRDGGDSGTQTDLPDFLVYSAAIGPASGALIVDRYGNTYRNFGISPPIPKIPAGGYVSVGEGYVAKGNIFWNSPIWTEDELRQAIKTMNVSIDIFAVIAGGQFNFSLNGYMALVYSWGFGLNVGGGLIVIGDEGEKWSRWSWDWMFHVPAPTREYVWNRVIKSYTDDPCGKCSVP